MTICKAIVPLFILSVVACGDPEVTISNDSGVSIYNVTMCDMNRAQLGDGETWVLKCPEGSYSIAMELAENSGTLCRTSDEYLIMEDREISIQATTLIECP